MLADVVMVWHAYQLNPRNFLEDCLRYGKMRFWKTGLPWAAVNSCIDNDTFEFNPGLVAVTNFETGTGYSWACMDESATTQVKCPVCKGKILVPLTSCNAKPFCHLDGSYSGFKGLDTGCGFADRDFVFNCDCGFVMKHEVLKTQKFRRDMDALVSADVPMPGTLLSLEGELEKGHFFGKLLI